MVRSADSLYRVGSPVRFPATDGSEFVYCRSSRVPDAFRRVWSGRCSLVSNSSPVAAHRSHIQHALGIEEADAVGTFDVLVREGFLVPCSIVYEQCANDIAPPSVADG
jgi:hypothetical protein